MTQVSVLMCAYNAGNYLVPAVQSILAQTLSDLELLIVDDGSTDNSIDLLSQLTDSRINLHRQENKGKSSSLNFMIKRAKGKYLVIQDADDLCVRHRLESLLNIMNKDTSLAMAMSGHSLILDDKVVAPQGVDKSKDQCFENIMNFRMPAHDPTLCVRADIANEFLFDPEIAIGQGLDFVLRVGEKYPIATTAEPLYLYRSHSSSITNSGLEQRIAQIQLVINKARLRRGMPPIVQSDFEKEYSKALKEPDNNLAGHFRDSAYQSRMQGNYSVAVHTALVSSRRALRSTSYLKPLVYAFAPRFLVEMIRNRKPF